MNNKEIMYYIMEVIEMVKVLGYVCCKFINWM